LFRRRIVENLPEDNVLNLRVGVAREVDRCREELENNEKAMRDEESGAVRGENEEYESRSEQLT